MRKYSKSGQWGKPGKALNIRGVANGCFFLLRCWIKKGDNQYLPKYVVPTVAHPEGVMVWAAMDATGGICLRRCPTTVDQAEYQRILGTALSFIRRRCVEPFFPVP
jgi:hypothetical protein